MISLRRLLTPFLFLAAATLSHGAATPHHAVAIDATIYTYTVSGTSSATLHSAKVNNRTILSSLVASGSVTGVVASDLDIVEIFPAIAVINKHTLAPVYSLATTGTGSSTTSTLFYGSIAHKLTYRITVLDYEFTLPEMSVFETGGLFTATLENSNMIEGLTESFSGGSGETQFIGRLHTTSKVYNF